MITKNITKKYVGYSIIEILIYVAILGTISIFSVESIISVFNGFKHLNVVSQISNNANVSLELMLRDIRRASDVDGDVSVFKTNPGVLRLIIDSGYVDYFLSGNILQRIENGGSVENITTSTTDVTNLVFFREISESGVSSEIIKIDITIRSGENRFQKSKKFFGSAVLRGMY